MLVLLRSKTYNIIDESLIFSSALFIPILSTLSSVSRNPAVSVNLTILFPILKNNNEKLFIEIERKNERFNSVIHLAGLKSVTESTFNPLSYWDVNVKGTINLLDVMSKFGCKTIIFSSSATIYGNTNKKLINITYFLSL